MGDPAARQGVLAQRQRELAAKLTPAGQVAGGVTDVEQGRDRLAELLRDRACLLVVDNVWTADDVYAFSVLGQRGALLVTTRDAGLVRASGAAEVEVAELSDAQARTLAAGWAAIPEQLVPPSVAETLQLVGNLALGVATVAALARDDRQRWAELAERLRRLELATLELRFPGYPHRPCWPRCNWAWTTWTPPLGSGTGSWPCSPGTARCHGQRWRRCGLRPACPPPMPGTCSARFGGRALLRRDPITGRVELHDLQFDLVARTSATRFRPRMNSCWPGTRPAARATGRPGRMTATSTSTWPRIWPRRAVWDEPGRAAHRRGVDAVPAARWGSDRTARRLHQRPGPARTGPGTGHNPAIRARPGG